MASRIAFDKILEQYLKAVEEEADPKLILSLKYASMSYGNWLLTNMRDVDEEDSPDYREVEKLMGEHGLDSESAREWFRDMFMDI